MPSFQSVSEISSLPITSSMDHAAIAILVAVSFLSLLGVIGILIAITVSAFNTRHSTDRFLFTRSHICAYFVCLLICWTVKCVGSALNIQWLMDRMIVTGNLCTAQGILKHVADVGIAVWTIVMAIHTFCVIFLERKMSRYMLWIILVLGWATVFFLSASGPLFIAPKVGAPFYSISDYSCGISPVYGLEKILLQWLVMLLAAFLSIILYVLTFLRLRGNIVLDGWKPTFHSASGKYYSDDQTRMVTKQMLLYPVGYAVMILPLAVILFIEWSGKRVTLEWLVFGTSVYLMAGLLNVVLFTTTRRLLPSTSLRVGSGYFVPSYQARARYGPSYDVAERGGSKTVTFAAAPTILCTPPGGRRDMKRPPALVLAENGNRDSMDSMYSVREGVHFMPLSSHWSPDTPPIHKVSRLSVVIDNMTAIAQKI